jgi:predicted Zn finger-like uncharacterized protein
MFTQCPDCGVAFRVTAEVLKMAAGKVRCGGCGVAFNALEHLSEEKPVARASSSRTPDPDLPELTPDEPVELEADTPPETISAEQSAALLKTLDQLAGEDIRIEDTGVEWRVLGEDDEEPESETESEAEPELIADTGSLKFIIESEEDAAAGEPSQVIDQMRFDDDTILPDDFDDVVDLPSPIAPPEPAPAPETLPEAPQIDLELSQPDEWDDLLGDLGDVDEEDEEEPEPEAEAEAAEDEIGAVAAEAEEPLDMDTQFAIQAEAMGIDLSGMHATIGEPDEEGEEEPEDELETSIEEDLMAAAFDAEAAVQNLEETASEEALEVEEAADEPENLEIDLQDLEEEETEDDVEDIALGFDDKVEQDIATLSMSMDEDEDEDEAEETTEEPADGIATSDDEHFIPEMTEEEKTLNMMIDQELFNIAVEDEDGFASTIVQLQPDDKVDEEIEENKDKSSRKGKKDKKRKKDKKKDKEKAAETQPQLAVETIVMEGEFVRGELDRERLAADKKAAPDSVGEGGYSIPISREKDDYERRREMTSGPPGTGTYAGIGALILLLLLQVMHQSREALATVPAFNSAVGPIYRMLGQPLTPTWDIAGWRFEATKDELDETGNVLTVYSRVGNNSDEALPYPLVHLSLTDRFEDVIGSTILEPGDYLPENADPRKLVPPGNTFNAVISIDSPPENAFGYKLNVCYRLAGGQLRCADFDFK